MKVYAGKCLCQLENGRAFGHQTEELRQRPYHLPVPSPTEIENISLTFKAAVYYLVYTHGYSRCFIHPIFACALCDAMFTLTPITQW